MKNSEAILKGKHTTLELTVSESLIKFWEDRANQRKRSNMPNQPMIIGGSGNWRPSIWIPQVSGIASMNIVRDNIIINKDEDENEN